MKREHTPHSTSASSAPDNVSPLRHTSTLRYRTSDLELGKKSVLRDLGPIPLVPVDCIESAVLPPLLPTIDVEEIRNGVKQSATINGPSRRWCVFSEDPKVDSAKEDAYLASIFSAVIAQDENQTGMKGRLDFINAPASAPISERSNTSRPDAYLLLEKNPSTEDRDCWDDIAVTFEFKKSAGTKHRYDNDRKVIWNAHHIMRSDPRRRFTFAVSIEGVWMRLWFTCRAATFVSSPFKFIADTTRLIRILCSLTLHFQNSRVVRGESRGIEPRSRGTAFPVPDRLSVSYD